MTDRAPPPSSRARCPSADDGALVLATWRQLLDQGSLQDGEPYLAGTAPAPVARVSGSTATALGVEEGDEVTVTAGATVVTVPVAVAEMADHVVWLPTNSAGCDLRGMLASAPGALVTVTKVGGAA